MNQVAEVAPIKEPRILSIAKLMLAVAWAPGRLEHEDVLRIRKYMSRNIQLTDEINQAFNLYLEYPIDPMERRRLGRRFSNRHTSSEARIEVVARLEEMLPKGKEPPIEKVLAIQEIKESLVEDQINFLKKVQYKLTRTPFPAKIGGLGREAFLEEYNANPIFFRLKLRFGDNFKPMGLSAKRAEKLSLEMALIGQVVYADQILLPEELDTFSQYLETYWDLQEDYVEMLITMALCRESGDTQIPLYCAQYMEVSTYEERHRLYLMLGKVARVDHLVTKSELTVLEAIAKGLEIPPGVRNSVLEDARANAVEIED
ncbi:MAG: TerB family tellurite resistance protein [Puniceicoccales bacterium]